MVDKTRASLIGRLRDPSDAIAWREFFDRYWRPMFAFAKRRGCSDQTAEEVLQEALVAVYETRDTFIYDPQKGKFRNWLFTIVRQKLALIRRRSDPIAEQDTMPADVEASCDAQMESDFERLFELGLLAAALEAVRRKVEPATYQAFELTELHGIDGNEAANVTGLKRNAVYLARKRVMQRLKESLSDYRGTGQLGDELKSILELYPPPPVAQAVTRRVETTFTTKQ